MVASVRRRAVFALLALTLFFGLLRVPEAEPPAPEGADGVPFVWGDDARWEAMRAEGERLRAAGCATPPVDDAIDTTFLEADGLLAALSAQTTHDDPRWADLEQSFFDLAAEVAACPGRVEELVQRQSRLRTIVKEQSREWGVTAVASRRRVYRLLQGSRVALEDALLQVPPADMPVLARGVVEPSATPSTEIHGIVVHSGDILVSRGGAPTSALIARGSDYPGAFSHVALVHVDEAGTFQTIEAHIERGVVVAPLETYEADPKLRVMLLRPRHDLAAIAADPQLPHRVAESAVRAAGERHIPYDFAMDHADPSAQFCSEVASANYRDAGIELWEGLTTMSTPGLARWLRAFGVTHFRTHGPSDLEYDPQLVVVAEWRDPATLRREHIDAAVIDVMLEEAAAGSEVRYDHGMLPVARMLKAISWVENLFGGEGRIPEGMSATVGLRSQWLDAETARRRAAVEPAIAAYTEQRGHAPTYPDLVQLARDSAPP